MADIYERMQGTASRLFKKFSQGVIQYVPPPVTSGDEWNPTTTEADPITVNGTAMGVSQEYVDGDTVRATDIELRLGVFSEQPEMSGKFTVDGQTLQIVRIMPKPAAGTTVAWAVICRA